MPPEYSYGLSVINSHLYVGGTLILNNFSIFEKKFHECLTKHQITNINGVPNFYEMTLKINIFEKNNFKDIKFMTQAGGALDPDTLNKIKKFVKKDKINFYIMYGATEASPRMSCFNLKNNLNVESGCIGSPLKNCKFKIERKNGFNELIFIGPNVFKGYVSNYKGLSIVNNITKLRTGDIAKVNKEELYFITGRIKRIIKVSGFRYSLDEIEKKLKKFFYIDFKCIGYDDALTIFYINTNVDEKIFLNKISKFLKLNIKYLKIIKLKNFPLNKRNKIDYARLQEKSKIN
jgi:acyl-CoA synthetase (AMP-forming)/AMP-acid ligase II